MTSRPRSSIAAARRELEAADHPQRRRLAAAGRPEEREELPGGDVDGHAVDRPDLAEALLQVDEADLGDIGGRHFVSRRVVRPAEWCSRASRATQRRAGPSTGPGASGGGRPHDAEMTVRSVGLLGFLGHQRVEVERRGAALAGRSPEQVALAGGDPQRADGGQLLAGLDALGDDRGAPARRQLLEGPQDAVRRVVEDPALDQGEVDLVDVEVDLRAAGDRGSWRRIVVARRIPPGGSGLAFRVAAAAAGFLDLLRSRKLDDELFGCDAAAVEDRGQLRRRGTGRTRGPRRTG